MSNPKERFIQPASGVVLISSPVLTPEEKLLQSVFQRLENAHKRLLDKAKRRKAIASELKLIAKVIAKAKHEVRDVAKLLKRGGNHERLENDG